MDWLHFLHEYEFGGCLADDMGPGKTIQTLAFLQSLQRKRPRQGRRPAGAAALADLQLGAGGGASSRPSLRLLNHAHATRAKDLAEFDDYDLVLTTYGILLRDIEMLRQHRFHYVMLDEAQAIKNPLSPDRQAPRACCRPTTG